MSALFRSSHSANSCSKEYLLLLGFFLLLEHEYKKRRMEFVANDDVLSQKFSFPGMMDVTVVREPSSANLVVSISEGLGQLGKGLILAAVNHMAQVTCAEEPKPMDLLARAMDG